MEIFANAGQFVAPLVGAVVAFYAIPQYRIQNRQKRAEMFFGWNKWFDSSEGFGADPKSGSPSILELLEDDDVRLAETPWEKREALLAFYEELALAVNSRLLRDDTANYMFGYYAVKIRKSQNFWKGLDKGDEWYWKLFSDFARRMEDGQQRLKQLGFNPSELKF